MKKNTFLLVIFFRVSFGFTQAIFDRSIEIEGLRIYPDQKLEKLYYYGPEGIEVAKNTVNEADFKLLMMRYSGTKLSQDQQKKSFKNIAQFRVLIKQPGIAILTAIKKRRPDIVLKAINLSQIESFLIYTPAVSTEKTKIINGQTEKANNNLASERVFTIQFSNEDAQLLETAFSKNQTLISVGYSIFAKGITLEKPKNILTSKGNLNNNFGDLLSSLSDSLQNKSIGKIALIGAGAIEIKPPENLENYINKIDINEQMPAEYASIEVRCYDFNNELRPDLYGKKIEIEALSVDNQLININTIFYKHSPDIYAKRISFDFAIKIENKFRYRITEIDNSGKQFTKAWKTKTDWSQIDITNN